MKKALEFIQTHGLLSGLIGSLLTVIVSLTTIPVVLATNYVSIDSFDVLIDKYFVKTGLVSEDIFALEPDKQFELVSNSYSDIKSELNKCGDELADILTISGKDTSTLKNMSNEDMLLVIKDQIRNSANQLGTIETLQNRIKELEAQTTAEIIATSLVVDGEQIDTNIPNSVANIDGHFFYSETLLNSFLEDVVSVDLDKLTVFYGDQRAEKVVFQPDMVTDMGGFATYAVGSGSSFRMGTDTYDNGFVQYNGRRSYFYANLKGKYSKMSFVIGHIDGSSLDNATIYIYTKNGNEQYRLLKSFDLTSDMFPEEKPIEVNHADGIQIVIEGGYYANYAIADIYLYK